MAGLHQKEEIRVPTGYGAASAHIRQEWGREERDVLARQGI
jgi:hypothetical protein